MKNFLYKKEKKENAKQDVHTVTNIDTLKSIGFSDLSYMITK